MSDPAAVCIWLQRPNCRGRENVIGQLVIVLQKGGPELWNRHNWRSLRYAVLHYRASLWSTSCMHIVNFSSVRAAIYDMCLLPIQCDCCYHTVHVVCYCGAVADGCCGVPSSTAFQLVTAFRAAWNLEPLNWRAVKPMNVNSPVCRLDTKFQNVSRRCFSAMNFRVLWRTVCSHLFGLIRFRSRPFILVLVPKVAFRKTFVLLTYFSDQ